MNRSRLFALLALLAFGLACQTTDILSSYLSPEPTPVPTRAPTRTLAPPALPLVPTPTPLAVVATPTAVEIQGVANENANIRVLPSTSAPIAGRISKGQQLTLTGRTAASDWYQVRLPTNPSAQGWISAPLVRVEGAERLPIVQPGIIPPSYPRP